MNKPGCGCGDSLTGASKYHHIDNHNQVVYAKKMNRDFLVSTDKGIVLGNKGDYVVLSETSGKRQLIKSDDWILNWARCADA